MSATEPVFAAFDLLFGTPEAWLVVVPGMLIGLTFAAVPGLTVSIATAVFLPATLYMDFLPAMVFLTAIFTGGSFGSAIPAILFNIPGQPAATATTFDGYPMTRQGRHNEALGIGLAASTVGMLLSYIVLALLVEPMAGFVSKLGPAEMLVVALWGLSLIAILHGEGVARGLLAGAFGLLLGTIGFSARGDIRGTMGFDVLLDGIPAVPALVGMFAASELFNLIGTSYVVADREARRLSLRRILAGLALTLRYPWDVVRGSMIGALIGAIPGVGGSVANLVSYAEAKRRAPNSEKFGHGDPRGVVAAESANSSSEGGSMAILLALGIPGGGATAVMLGAFAMHNVIGGPRFMAESKDIVYAIIFANFAQALVLLVLGIVFIWFASAIVKIPVRVLVPAVLVLGVFGCYSIAGNMAGPATLFVFAVLGWLMRIFDYPVVATVVGLLLGRMTEGALLRTWQFSEGDPLWILGRPVAFVLLVLLALSFAWPVIARTVRARKARA